MKKLLIAIKTMGIIIGCTHIQNVAAQDLSRNVFVKSAIQDKKANLKIPTNLSSKEFAKKLIKQTYPEAVYDDGRWYPDSEKVFVIEFVYKDIQTKEGEKRYVSINQHKSEGIHLFIFTKETDSWVLEQKINNESPIWKKLKLEESYDGVDINVVALGPHQFGFQLEFLFGGGTGGEGYHTYWVYNTGNKFNSVSGCVSVNSRASSLNFECTAKIRSNIKSADSLYPIELSYHLTKYDVISGIVEDPPKGYDWDGGGYASKKLGSRKGKVIIEFDTSKQAYKLPASFEKALKSENENSLWNYLKK